MKGMKLDITSRQYYIAVTRGRDRILHSRHGLKIVQEACTVSIQDLF